jgi:hypothetical protein
MKKKLSKILGVGLVVALLGSLSLVSMPVGALSVPEVTIPASDDEISFAGADYAIFFTIHEELGYTDADTFDKIVITFPDDTTVAAPTATIAASPGWIGGSWSNATTTSVNWDFNATNRTISAELGAGDEIGEGASVRIEITAGITNPSSPGTAYTLTVGTVAEDATVDTTIEAAVASNTYTINPPAIISPAGVVRIFNPGGIEFQPQTGDDAINLAVNNAGAGWTIVIGEGRYPNAVTDTGAFDGLIIQGTAGADVVIANTVAMDGPNQTLEGVTIEGVVTLGAGADDATVNDCTFSGGGAVVVADDCTDAAITDCTFDVANAAIGIDCQGNGADEVANITGCDFTLVGTGIGINTAATSDGGTVTGCTFTGGSGEGAVLAGDTNVTDCTFDGVDTALEIDGGTMVISGNTIQACEALALDVDGAADVQITANTITGNNEAVLINVAADAEFVQMMFNDILDNAGDANGLLIDNDDTGVNFNCTNNWWGDKAGPGAASFSADVLSTPFLTGSVGDTGVLGTAVAAGTLWDERDTVGVTLQGTGGAMEIVGAARYSDNPGTAAPDGEVAGYWDVCVIDTDDDVTAVSIRLYLPAISADMVVQVWAEARGEWLDCVATPNLFGGFIGIDVDADSVPTLEDLEELPFVVVTPPAPPPTLDATSLLPANGADDVSVTPTFSWGEVTGALYYEFALAEALTGVTPFSIIDYSATSDMNAHPCRETLKYSTSYYWRVRGITGEAYTVGPPGPGQQTITPATEWAVGLFTTEAEPTEVEEAPIEVTVEPADVDVTVEPAETPDIVVEPTIPDYLLWTIIAVGAVLVIALIVLIVRTRRTV